MAPSASRPALESLAFLLREEGRFLVNASNFDFCQQTLLGFLDSVLDPQVCVCVCVCVCVFVRVCLTRRCLSPPLAAELLIVHLCVCLSRSFSRSPSLPSSLSLSLSLALSRSLARSLALSLSPSLFSLRVCSRAKSV
jgi:hypothetical protein